MFNQIKIIGDEDPTIIKDWKDKLTSKNGYDFAGEKPYQIGIQSMPGLKFYLNIQSNNIDYPIIIGPTGIFELSLESTMVIENIKFDETTFNNVLKSKFGYLIIDYLYEGGKDNNV